MNKILALVGAVVIAGGTVIWWKSQQGTGTAGGGSVVVANVAVPELSATAAAGRDIFDAKCATCHGENAAGRDGKGPPLIHKIYEPSHHADMSFQMAVERGVRGHHWPFGDMPPVDGVSREDVGRIIAYVRELQRANGID